MAMTGLFGGFYFDPEEFSRYMTENPTWNDRILASGVLVQDNTIMDLMEKKVMLQHFLFINQSMSRIHRHLTMMV